MGNKLKTVVVTGSGRGFGLELLKFFKKKNFNIVACDISEKSLNNAKKELDNINGNGEALFVKCDITLEADVLQLIEETLNKFSSIDVFINNAGVNQPNKAIWELEKSDIDRLIDIDLKGTILCSKLIMPVMIKQRSGQIFNVEGYGSNDAKMLGLSIYGTTKRAITYFTEALAKEVKTKNLPICIGKITPGIMITNFISTSLGDGEEIILSEQTKRIYNILGDYPETIAKFMVDKIVKNKKNGVKFTWLSNSRAFRRFLFAGFTKRNFFK